MRRFDAIIIGAGQAGPSLAGKLTAAGLSVACMERKLFGGSRVNTGCIPTKTLVGSANVVYLAPAIAAKSCASRHRSPRRAEGCASPPSGL